MKKTIISIFALAICIGAAAQGLSREDIKNIRASFVKDAATVAAQNALTHNLDVKALAQTRSSDAIPDDYFKYSVTPFKSAPNQYTSGRCWLFTSLNAIRPYAIEKFNVEDFRFSHVYDSFWDLFEKSNFFLENIIATAKLDIDSREVNLLFKTPVGDGAAWNHFVNLAEKYGVAPESAMSETPNSNNTANMRTVLNRKLRKEGWEIRQKAAAGASEKELRAYKMVVMKDVYRILALCMGEPCTEFTWEYTDKNGRKNAITTTPQEFYKMIVPKGYGFKSHIMVMNDPTKEYYKMYSIKSFNNIVEGTPWVYLNLPNEEIKAMALATIKDNLPVYASCDWRKGMNEKSGVMAMDNYDFNSLFGVNLDMDKEQRIISRYSTSAHAMLIIACDTDDNDKPVKWQFFNSYFINCDHETLIFTDQWFDEYMFRFCFDRKYLSEKALKASKTKPVECPMWDPMG